MLQIAQEWVNSTCVQVEEGEPSPGVRLFALFAQSSQGCEDAGDAEDAFFRFLERKLGKELQKGKIII